MDDGTNEAAIPLISPIACPLLEGKALERSLRLIKKAVMHERNSRLAVKTIKETSITKKATVSRCIKRGVQEVTKALRKGTTGILFLAADVHPVEIIAHLPVLCEEKDLLYAFIGSKKTLGAACRSKRATCAILLTPFPAQGSVPAKQVEGATDGDYSELYKKVTKSIKAIHPFF